MTNRVLPWLGAALGLLWLLVMGAGPALDPTNLGWAGGGDIAQHVLGWLHFRNAPWGFPLGTNPTLLYPLSPTVGYTDSNPWVSIALKPLSPWLPQDFQFVGPWLGLCFALQGWMGVRLVSLLSPRASHQLLGASLFVMAPVLLWRTGHDTLCAHWMILAMLWLHLRPRVDTRAAWRTLGGALLVNVLASGVHPYLEVMVFALTASLLFSLAKLERLLSWRAAGGALAGVLLTVGLLFYLLGYVGQGVSLAADYGFGHFSSDTLTLINPMGWSLVLPEIPVRSGQYEGFGYLGTGVLALTLASLWKPSAWWPRATAELKARAPLAVVVLALTVLALSTVVTVAGHIVLTARGLTQALLPLLTPFRASGRFIWVLDYTLMTGVLALVLWRWRQNPKVATGLLLGAALLQFVDTREVWYRGRFHGAAWPRLEAPAWAEVDSSYRHIAMFPTYIAGLGSPCDEGSWPEDLYVRFGDLAYRKGMTTNSAYLARVDQKKALAACGKLRADVGAGHFAEDTVYVVSEPEREAFLRLASALTCGVLDGHTVCVAAREGRFREALQQAPRPPELRAPSAGNPP